MDQRVVVILDMLKIVQVIAFPIHVPVVFPVRTATALTQLKSLCVLLMTTVEQDLHVVHPFPPAHAMVVLTKQIAHRLQIHVFRDTASEVATNQVIAPMV